MVSSKAQSVGKYLSSFGQNRKADSLKRHKHRKQQIRTGKKLGMKQTELE